MTVLLRSLSRSDGNLMRLSRYGGFQNLGVFAVANEEVSFIASDASEEFVKDVQETLEVETVLTTMASSFVVGSLIAMNSSGAAVSSLADISEIEKVAQYLDVAKVFDKVNAAGNNILVNDKGAIVNPDLDNRAIRGLNDVFGVECVRGTIAGFKTVGSVAKVTNTGCICHPEAKDSELQLIKDVLKVEFEKTTVIHGVAMVGACVLANSKGALLGDDTTPIEMGKVEEGLHLY